ncbi:Mono(2-hydroxyethyl) terephthalate hydrolase [Methylobacterium crusticola]|uniref:Mono(2-hydroxyethyl) terephthalate hydrolase n=1 Tax=Methylobacterium crusticola TaxID=1697972 RepID=A0ABQ4QT49_9HYPH|nr:tannase/feruloyl esterase family alpha/beta hydrolase [Methylobacterium crusticola]GJD47884.1 Mono(2-hydroxyethyl) terephthalate hydrolase [Methylobacterium crusticola]
MRGTIRLFSMAACLGGALAAAPARAAECGGLAGLKIEAVNLLSAVEVPAAGDLPAHCRVLGYVRPAVNFEVRLPLAGWNGKFYETGCGGFCGTLASDAPGFTNAMNHGLRRGYAVSTMDSGHWGTGSADGRWAASDLVARMDWGQRAVTETARASKVLIRAFYGRDQQKSYFAGCSTGGRMAAMEALRYPKDFDGIISGAPALDYTGLVATAFAWVTKANTGPDGAAVFPGSKVKLVADAVAEACGGEDGRRTGLIGDPRQCGFKPASLRCTGAPGAECLSEAEIGVLEKWYAGPTDAAGRRLYPGGIPLGSEPHWPRWLTGLGNAPPILPLFAGDFLRYMAFQPSPGPAYRVTDYDFEADPARLASQAQVYNAATFDPASGAVRPAADLAGFRSAGGKLLLYHGWSDPLVTPFLTVAFYEALAKGAGGLGALRDTARLFLVPGMDHCGIGTDGPGIADTGIDPLTALERWVEAGQAPDALVATKRDAAGAPLWSRPVCAYPQVARGEAGACAEP